MKKNPLRPCFELIFCTGVIACLILPPMVFAQEPKQIKVMIINGDTTVNGKNLKELSANERTNALNEMKKFKGGPGNGPSFRLRMRKMGNDTLADDLTQEMIVNDKPMARLHFRGGDSIAEFHLDRKKDDGQRNMNFNYHFKEENEKHPREWGMDLNRREPFMMAGRRNSQSFSYASTDKNGISTSVNFSVSDVNRETLKRISGAEKPDLTINDLVITPAFSTGKTNIGFALAEKGNAEVQLKDSEGKVLWTDKTTGGFYKSFELPQNGIYYLQVKQGSKLALRRIIKEQ